MVGAYICLSERINNAKGKTNGVYELIEELSN
jgi:hypothetical protein